MDARVVVTLDGPPSISVRKNIVRVVDHSGGYRIERAMAVPDLAEYVARGQRALDRYAKGEQDIVEGD